MRCVCREMKASKGSHKSFGRDVCLGRPFDAGVMMGCNYATFVYTNLAMQRQIQKLYSNGVMSVADVELYTRLFKVLETF